MIKWLSGRVQWPPKDPLKVLAKVAVLVLPVVTLWLNVSDVYVKLLGSAGSIVGEFFVVGYISKFTVPEAFAVGYFKSFVEPIGEALRTGDASITYKDPVSGSETSAIQDLKQVDARLEIVLPKDLSVKDTKSENGLLELQKSVNAKTEGNIHLTKSRSDRRKRGFTVHFDLSSTQGIQRLVIFDVPNNLNPLRDILYDEAPDQPSREKGAERVLGEFSDELRKKLDKAVMEKVSIS